MTSSLVMRLLRRNISPGQIAGYALANFIGLAIVMTALQFYRDVNSVMSGDDSFISRDYLILSKKVEGMGSLMGSKVDFTPEEISDLESQPWVRKVGEFTAAAFNVNAAVEFGGRSLSTSMFLEAIPDEFFDVKPKGWNYDGRGALPVIISKDYLTLYNFGFAASRGMPQVSEAMISMVPLRLSVSGNGRQDWIDARIVGFSSRLNTIAVPKSFLDSANATYAEQPLPQPSRLIVELNTPGDPAVTTYLKEHSLESAGDKVDNGRTAYFLSIITAVVIAVGTVISLLALFILLLSIYLLLQKNREKLHQLMELGYTPMEVSRRYIAMVAWVNLGVVIAAIAVMLIARHMWSQPLSLIDLHVTAPWITIAVGIAAIIVITAVNVVAITRKVKGAFRL